MTAPRIPDLPASFTEGDIPELPGSFGPRPLAETLRSLTTPAPVADVTAQENVRHDEIGMFDPNRATKLEALRHRAGQFGQAPSIGPENVEETSTSQELGRFLSLRSDSDWWRRINTFDRMSSAEDPTGATSTLRGLVSGPGRMLQSLLGPTLGEAEQGIGSALTLHPSDAVSHGISALTGTGRLATGFASGLVNGFVTDVVRLDYDRQHGGNNLLPEERQQMQKNVVMNYGGLVIGGAARGTVLENQAMNQLAREAGVSSEVLGRVLTPPELEHLTSSVLGETNGMRLGARGRITAGIQEGAIGGAGGAALAGEKPGDVLAYGLMAAPLGLAFEMFGAAKHVLGDAPSTARDYLRLRSLQAIDDLSASSAAQASLSLGDHPDVARLWAFNAERQPGDVMVMTGVDRVVNGRVKEVLNQNNLNYAIHENPNGALDLFIGDEESLAAHPEIRKNFEDTGFAPHEIVMYQGRAHVVSSVGKAREGAAVSVILNEVGTGRPTEPILASELSRPPRSDFAEPPMIFRTELSQTKVVGEDGKPLEFYRGIPDPSRPYEPTQYDGRYGKGIYFSTNQETASAYARFYVPNGSEPIRAGLTDAERTAAIDFANQQYRAAITGNRPEMTPEAAAAMSKLGQTPVVTRARLVMKNPVEIDGDLMVNVDNGMLAEHLRSASETESNATVRLLTNRLAERLETDKNFEPKYYDLQNVFEGDTNKILADMGYDGLVIKNGEILADETWGVAFEDKAITSPWTESELYGRTTLPNEAAVSSRLDAIADAAISSLKERLDTTEPIDFDNLVQNLAATVGAKASEVPFLSNLIEKRLGEALIPELLDAREIQVRSALIRNLSEMRAKEGEGLVDRALNSGFLIEREGGSVNFRNMKDGTIVGRFSSIKEANEFVKSSGANGGTHLDAGNGSVPPRVFAGGLFDGNPPEQGPHTVKFSPDGLGFGARLRAGFNASYGKYVTTMRDFLIALDNIHGTSLYSKVYLPLQEAALKKNAAMSPYLDKIGAASRLATGLGKDALDHIVTYMETMNPEEVVTSLFQNRKLSEREIQEAAWFANNNIDIAKVFAYRRDLMDVEKSFNGQPEEAIRGAVKEVQDNHQMSPAELEAADRLTTAITARDPEGYSPYAIVRLANSLMNKELSRENFKASLGDAWTKQMETFAGKVEELFKEGADEFDIPDARRLTNYFSHYRKFDLNEAVPSKNGAPRFVSDLQRVGEMSEIDRDPISVLMRYFNTGFGERHLAQPLQAARFELNNIAKRNPQWGPQVKETVTNNYVNELRGIPKDEVALTKGFFDKLLNGLGIHGVSGSRDIVNTVLSLSSSSALGFRPMQAARDLASFLGMYTVRFGSVRAGRMLNTINKWTPKQLYEAGILESPPETVAGLSHDMFGGPQVARELAEQGIIPTNNPIRVLSAAEQQQTQLLGGAGKFRRGVQQLADVGMNWSFQHTVYQWAHAATYLESLEHTSNVLTDLSLGGTNKTSAYKKLSLSTYDRAVQVQFDRMVTGGDFEAAAKMLAQTTAAETIPTFGLANAPMGWTSNVGRLFGQFGFYPTWARSQVSRMLLQGTLRDRMAAAARLGVVTGATKAASGLLGLSFVSWYLPYAGGVVDATETLNSALNTPEGTNQRDRLMARSMWKFALGVPGQAMFGGGPSTTVLRSALALGDMSQANDDEAVNNVQRMWILGVPGGFQGRDLLRAYKLQQQGYNPITVFAQGFGLQPTGQPSQLEPGGVVRP